MEFALLSLGLLAACLLGTVGYLLFQAVNNPAWSPVDELRERLQL